MIQGQEAGCWMLDGNGFLIKFENRTAKALPWLYNLHFITDYRPPITDYHRPPGAQFCIR
jgi:hypothetical protein